MPTSTPTQATDFSRRDVLRAGAGAALGAAALGSGVRPALAASDPDAFEAWLADVDNYEGIADERGAAEVTVAVGAPGNDGDFAFEPAAVRIDPGTAVVWEWTGKGGVHNVLDADDAYESEMLTDAGETFEHTFESEGVSRYSCLPHESMGMKGAVLVGGVAAGDAPPEVDYGDWFDGVENFTGTVDRTGQRLVRIAVGAAGNGGPFAFEPAAVRVDPGTTVVWEWTGDGDAHSIAAADGSYDADLTDSEGATHALRFDGVGVSKYTCPSHAAQAMRGAVVVGDPMESVVDVPLSVTIVGGGLLAAALSPLGLAALLKLRGTEN
ncbi:halocyanin domain-containing protein [Haloarcula nitratireducens]|uniref:Halocyanin domain-containing protein n=1 Tax=Haloarcula nitratireducens TaxID=2487749 RepID=A0AAW4PC81_9EURY|nr:halocyanin domain-containing protein [Halomicroarcula nitratireducens]MBX0295168.1 halocyanin domain-containing protein [Halomicroarcula nitratireducens]